MALTETTAVETEGDLEVALKALASDKRLKSSIGLGRRRTFRPRNTATRSLRGHATSSSSAL